MGVDQLDQYNASEWIQKPCTKTGKSAQREKNEEADCS